MKTKVMIKKKSNVRKYSRKVKNKKVKYSKKLMSGGGNTTLSFTIPKPTTFSLKKPLKFTINTPFEKKIMELYEFSKLEADKDYISQIFRKFKYSYAQTNPAYKETDSILYLKKDEVDKEINPTKVFKVYAPTNQSISIEYNDDKKFKDIGKFYEITPLELSVDTMQLAVNTGKLEISTDKDGNSYLGFVDFPSLVITEKPSGTGFSYSSRKNATWISVYEEEFEEKDKLFDLIETMDGRHIEQSTFDSEIESIDVKISKLDKTIYKDSVKIRKLEELKPKKKGDVPMTNEELFIKKQEEMRQLLSEPESDEKAKLKLKIEEQVKYRAYVNIEEDGDGDGSNKNVITEDISWAMKNSLWLEKYLKIKTEDNNLKANELLEKIGEEYECDLSGLDEKYLIVDEFKNESVNGGDNLEYVICGYPEKKMKEHILNFWQGEKMRVELDKVHKEQKNIKTEMKYKFDKEIQSNIDLFVDLYNQSIELEINNLNDKLEKELNDTEITKIRKQIEDTEISKINNKDKDLHKFFKVKQYYNYINLIYKNKYKENNKDYKTFINSYVYNGNIYYNKIANLYLKKLMTKIKYVFLIFKKNKINNELSPCIFNIKELTRNHQLLLKRVNLLIRNELPYRFNIDENNYNPILSYPLDIDIYNDTALYKKDKEYKLFYSRYEYGIFFSITTDYLHTMSNLIQKDYKYQNTITLEEIIYSSNLLTDKGNLSFLKVLKIIYRIREYKLSIPLKNKNNKDTYKENFKIADCLKLQSKSRTDIAFCLFEEEKLRREYKKNNNLTDLIFNKKNFQLWKNKKIEREKVKIKNINLYNNLSKIIKTINIIIILKSNIQEYTIIYKFIDIDDKIKIFKLVIESNISNIINSIINKLNDLLITNIKLSNKSIIFDETDNIKLFKVISNDELNGKDYKDIFTYNPIISYYINQNKFNRNKFIEYDYNNPDINTSVYYDNALLKNDNTENISRLLNLYNINLNQIYPKLIENFLKDKYYLSGQNKDNDLFCHNRIEYEDKFKGCDRIDCDNSIINCIYYNINNCGYNFVEIVDNVSHKIVVHIIPYNLDDKTYKFLGNITDLNDKSIEMCKQLHKLYSSTNTRIYCHIIFNTLYYCLHFHIVKADNYNRDNTFTNKGSYIFQDIFIEDIINNLNNNSNYYKNSNFTFMRQQ